MPMVSCESSLWSARMFSDGAVVVIREPRGVGDGIGADGEVTDAVAVGAVIWCVFVACTGSVTGAIDVETEAVYVLEVLPPVTMFPIVVSIDAMIASAPLTNPSIFFQREPTTGCIDGALTGTVIALVVYGMESIPVVRITIPTMRVPPPRKDFPDFMPVIMTYNPYDYFKFRDGEVCITGGYFCPDS